jgi:hypothetical protein
MIIKGMLPRFDGSLPDGVNAWQIILYIGTALLRRERQDIPGSARLSGMPRSVRDRCDRTA